MLNLLSEVGRLLRLAAPMMLAQGGLMTMGVVDTLMIGRVSVLHMGAVSLGNTLAGVVMVLGLGLVMGLEPLVSQAHGAGETVRARRWLNQGIWLALLGAVPSIGLLLGLVPLLGPVGISPEIAGVTTVYILARLPGVPFNLLYGACRSYLTSVERVRPVLIAVVIANGLNAALDGVLLFVFDLGAVGVGLATSAGWIAMFLVVGWASREPKADRRGLGKPVKEDLHRVAHLGWPIGLQLAVEVGIFALVGVLVARFGEVWLAGHHIALTLASLTFMACVGIAVGATTRVGMLIGAGRGQDARRAGFVAITLGGCMMALSGLVFLLVPEWLAGLFAPNDPEVVQAGAALLRIAAVFAICDGIQVVAAGALRGAGDTRWPFYVNAVGHWFIGLPVALALGFSLDLQAEGFWWALSVGLTFVAVVLTLRFSVLSKRPLARA